MSIILIAAPTSEPVTIEEFCEHARIDSTDDASDIALKLQSARLYVEGQLHRALITSTWQYNIECWPCKKSFIEIPQGNLQSVAFVKYTQPDGSVLTWDPANYRLQRIYDPASGVNDAKAGRLFRGYNIPWPPGPRDYGESISIQFTSGWKDAAAVPAPIKSAIELLAAHWYRNREAVAMEARAVNAPLAMAVESLLSEYVIYG